VSGEFEDLAGGVNFARGLLNIGLGGMSIETTGRLRPNVKMSADVRFEGFGGALRAQAQVVWAETKKEGALEVHVAGVRFITPEYTATVREFLEGGRATMIMAKRRADYEDLKQKSEASRDVNEGRRWGAPKKAAVLLIVLILLYAGSFGMIVWAGRRESASSGTHFRYAGADSKGGRAEETLAKLYLPLYWALRKIGVDLTYDAP
jgi:hypothetical protein